MNEGSIVSGIVFLVGLILGIWALHDSGTPTPSGGRDKTIKDKNNSESKEHLQPVPVLAVAVLLIVAVLPLPYGYYTFLRLVTCGAAAYTVMKAYQWKRAWAIWLFVAIAVLFNPFVPVYLTKKLWQWVDVVTALVFGLSMIFVTSKGVD